MVFNFFKLIGAFFLGSDKNSVTTTENAIWKAMTKIIYFGLIMIVFICIQNFYKPLPPINETNIEIKSTTDKSNNNYYVAFFKSVGLLVLIGGASFMSGGLTGFLFGIPKLIQNTNINGNTLNDNQTIIVHNDNLVQVSDWLTKIIVGVGLTQLFRIPEVLQNLGKTIELNANDNCITLNISIAVIVYFSVTGFGCSYLWTRLYFTRMLASTNNDVNALLDRAKIEIEQKDKDIEKKDKDLKAVANTFMPEFEKMKFEQKSTSGEGTEDNEDPQKGKWGGTLKANDRIVTAKVETSSFSNDLFSVTLNVASTSTSKPLIGEVKFHLHPTFKDPDKIIKVINGIAELNLVAYGAFTVGIECDNGLTQLEIDLATDVPGVPELFRER